MEVVKMWLSEKILSRGKGHRNFHQQLQKIREPNPLWPEWGDEGHLDPMTLPEFPENLMN